MSRAPVPTLPNLLYRTALGTAHVGDALHLLPAVADTSVQLVMTSPPFALTTPKSYGNEMQDNYVKWFRPLAKELRRVLKDDGSVVIDIGGGWEPGRPVRSIYHFELLVDLVRECSFFLAEEFYWFNKAKLPSPAQWVNVERIRVKDAVNPVWWLSKTARPKADNKKVLRPYTVSMQRLIDTGAYNRGRRPSGHVVGDGFTKDNGGAIPPNLIEVSNTRWDDPYQEWCRAHRVQPHPARYPRDVPDFFIRFLTDKGDLVLDPFAGSNVTGAVAEQHGRRWLAFEKDRGYLRGSRSRFQDDEGRLPRIK